MRRKTRVSNLELVWVPHDFRNTLLGGNAEFNAKRKFGRKSGREERRGRSAPLRPEVQSALEPFLRTVARASESALLLDYDGTLAPFHTQRDQAFPYPGVALLLQEIMRDG